jgi:hypothetical protein
VPRSNRRRRDEIDLDLGRALGGAQRRESHPDGEWFVRSVTGAASAKAYRCPGCVQEVRAGLPHVVAWPADGPWSDAAALGGGRATTAGSAQPPAGRPPG